MLSCGRHKSCQARHSPTVGLLVGCLLHAYLLMIWFCVCVWRERERKGQEDTDTDTDTYRRLLARSINHLNKTPARLSNSEGATLHTTRASDALPRAIHAYTCISV